MKYNGGMRWAILVLGLAAGCSDDGGGGGDGGGVMTCMTAEVGITVNVTVSCTMLDPCDFAGPIVRVNYPGAGLIEYGIGEGVHLDAFAGTNMATFFLEYPGNANTGPATAVFYADAAPGYHFHGETAFDSYPTGCITIGLAGMDVLGD